MERLYSVTLPLDKGDDPRLPGLMERLQALDMYPIGAPHVAGMMLAEPGNPNPHVFLNEDYGDGDHSLLAEPAASMLNTFLRCDGTTEPRAWIHKNGRLSELRPKGVGLVQKMAAIAAG